MGKHRVQWLVLSLLAAATMTVMACHKSSSDSAAAPPAASPTGPSAAIKVAAIDAEDAKQWNDSVLYPSGSFPYKAYTSNGHSTVPTNRVVWLEGSATPPGTATVTGYTWSGATFSYLAGDTLQQKPYFTPASPGTYTIGVTASFSDGTSADCSLAVTAANYVGQLFCAGCHATLYNDFQRTASTDGMNHALAWSEKTTGKRANISTSCMKCHSVGYDYASLGGTSNPDNIGFDDPTRHGLANDGTSWYVVADAALSGTNELPVGSGIRYTNTSVLNQPPAQGDLSGIQCENCHGPGGEHFGDTSKIGRGYSEKTCTSLCHGRGHGGPYDFEQSAHSRSAKAAGGIVKGASCNKCMTSNGFIEVQDKLNAPMDLAKAESVTCAACHDPHTPEHHYILRFHGEVEASGVSVDAEVSAACVKCHTDDDAEVGHEPHHPQAEMFYGTTLAGGKGSNYAGKTYGDMEHVHGVHEGCAQCHMAKTLTSTGKRDPGTAQTTLVQDITASTASFLIGSNSNLPLANSTLRIDNEQIDYSAITASNGATTVVVSARGANGTTAAAHSNGAYVTWGSNSRDRMGGHTWKVRDDVKGDDVVSVSDAAAWLAKKADNHYNVSGCNDCHRQFYAPATSVSGTPLRTNLTNGMAIGDATITVSDTTGFPSAGTIQIGSELITYTGTTATTFTGAIRGSLYGTGATLQKATGTPVPASKFAVVVPNSIPVADTAAFPNAGVVLIEYENSSNRAAIKEKIAYFSKTATSLDGCLRGIDGTSGGIVRHPNATAVTLLKGVQLVLAPAAVQDHTTTLGTAMTATTAVPVILTVGNATGWAASGVVKIDSEFMSYDSATATTINITARALYGTAAAAHTVDATAPKVYLAAFGSTAGDTITVGDTGGPLPFLVPGLVKVNGEIIKYTGKTATTLTGLTRGLAGTMAVPHMPGEVAELQLFSPYVDASPVTTQIPNFQAQIVSMLKALEDLLPQDGGEVMVDGTGMTDAQKKAAFNYYFVKNDGSHGVHNFKYAMQLLYDSIIAMGGAPPYPRP